MPISSSSRSACSSIAASPSSSSSAYGGRRRVMKAGACGVCAERALRSFAAARAAPSGTWILRHRADPRAGGGCSCAHLQALPVRRGIVTSGGHCPPAPRPSTCAGIALRGEQPGCGHGCAPRAAPAQGPGRCPAGLLNSSVARALLPWGDQPAAFSAARPKLHGFAGPKGAPALHQSRTLLPGVQPPRARAGLRRVGAAARAAEVPVHLLQQPGRVLRDPRRRPQAAAGARRRRAAGRRRALDRRAALRDPRPRHAPGRRPVPLPERAAAAGAGRRGRAAARAPRLDRPRTAPGSSSTSSARSSRS